MLSPKEKVSLKRQYVNLLKEHLSTTTKANLSYPLIKFKELISDLKCEILKPFFKRPGTITLTSHDVIFFDDLVNG